MIKSIRIKYRLKISFSVLIFWFLIFFILNLYKPLFMSIFISLPLCLANLYGLSTNFRREDDDLRSRMEYVSVIGGYFIHCSKCYIKYDTKSFEFKTLDCLCGHPITYSDRDSFASKYRDYKLSKIIDPSGGS